jgi:hypothetical protein
MIRGFSTPSIGAITRKTWDSLRASHASPEWYLDLETSENFGLTQDLSRLADLLDLNVTWLTRQNPKTCPGADRTLILSSNTVGTPVWRSLDNRRQKLALLVAGAKLSEYERAVLGLARWRGIVLPPSSLPIRQDLPETALDIQQFFLLSRPFLLARDEQASLPRPSGTPRPTKDNPSRFSGWSEYGRLQAAAKALEPLFAIRIAMAESLTPEGGQMERWQERIGALWERFHQLLFCRDEIEWSVCMKASNLCYRFDHFILLATAFLDQLADLLVALRDEHYSPSMKVSMSPSRSGGQPYAGIVRKGISLCASNVQDILLSPFFHSFRTFVYDLRNLSAHRFPSKSMGFGGSHRLPNDMLIPIRDGPLMTSAQQLQANSDPLVTGSILKSEENLLIDPLVSCWLITGMLAEVARPILGQLALKLQMTERHLQKAKELDSTFLPIEDCQLIADVFLPCRVDPVIFS